jgi:DNA-binding MurR/RpiR family transcriptional regulator
MNEFHQKVNAFYQTAKRAKRVVAEFFLTHPEEAAFMTLDEIAARTGVSPATITRTATEIGFKGYPDLQEEIRKSVRRSLAPVERLETKTLPEGSLGYRESIAIDQQNLSALASLNDDASIEKAIELLSTAPQVHLTGSRSSYSPVSFLGFMLAQIRPRVRVITENEGRIPEQVLDVEQGDLLLAIALPRYAKTVVDTMKEAKNRGCQIISVSDSSTSPLSQLSDISLFVPYESYSFFNSTVSALALFNALVTGVNVRLGASALKRLQEHGALMEQRELLLRTSSRFSEKK